MPLADQRCQERYQYRMDSISMAPKRLIAAAALALAAAGHPQRDHPADSLHEALRVRPGAAGRAGVRAR